MTIATITFITLFSIILGFVQGLQSKDRIKNQHTYDVDLSDKWHLSQAILHVLVATFVFVNTLPNYFSACFGFFMTLFIIWAVFDFTHNKVAGLPTFHKGKNKMDRIVGKLPVAVELMIKLILVLVTTTYFVVNPFK